MYLRNIITSSKCLYLRISLYFKEHCFVSLECFYIYLLNIFVSYYIILFPQHDEGELSEAFKAQIGLSPMEGFNEVAELEMALEEERDATLTQFNFAKYAKEHFKKGQTPNFTKEHLQNPLIPKKQDVDKLVS